MNRKLVVISSLGGSLFFLMLFSAPHNAAKSHSLMRPSMSPHAAVADGNPQPPPPRTIPIPPAVVVADGNPQPPPPKTIPIPPGVVVADGNPQPPPPKTIPIPPGVVVADGNPQPPPPTPVPPVERELSIAPEALS